ncbi:MAG: hypothetical protein DMG57_28405 [Acidobacteria bacterium]|nr:MAG: hypothetical protein DMG57_28405 [Acidobacteriota bacterium]
MPSAQQVAWAKTRVAAMVGSALAILSAMVYVLVGGSDFFRPSEPVRTHMVDLQGLAKGSPIRFNGIRVGEVKAVRLSHLNDPQKVVEVDMSILDRYISSIPEDSTVTVAADTVIGDKFADINQGKSPQHLQPGGELVSPPRQEINKADIINEAHQVMSRMDGLFADIEAGRGEFGKFFKEEEVYNRALGNVVRFQSQMRSILATESQMGRLLYDESSYEEILAPIRRVNQKLAELDAGQSTGGKFLKNSAQYDQVHKSIADLNRNLAQLNSGKKGAALLKNDEAYNRIYKMLVNLETQIDAFNAGEGPLGHMMVNSSLYDNLQGVTASLQILLNDLRGNPRKFLRKKLF